MRTFSKVILFSLFFLFHIIDASAQAKAEEGMNKGISGSPGSPVDLIGIFVSPTGDDKWSGRYAEPTADKKDGPLATVTRALEIVRFFKGGSYYSSLPSYIKAPGRLSQGIMQGPVVIWLRGGNYYIDKTIEIGLNESYPITIKAYPGETPVLNGGVPIKDWKVTKVNGVTAWSSYIPDLASGKWNITQLFVNDTRAQRCRYPKTGFFIVEDPLIPTDRPVNPHAYQGNEFISAPGDIKPWKGITEGEVIILYFWIVDRLPIKSFDPATRRVTTDKMTRKVLLEAHPAHTPGNAKYYLENIFETLTNPGEWFADKKTGILYYIPKPGEMPENSQVYAPWTVSIINITGNADEDKYVENIHFEGLTFKNSAYYDGTNEKQATPEPKGLISLNGVRFCSITGCTFTQIGETVIAGRNCKGLRIVGNTFKDMGGSGIVLDGMKASHNLISDNSISAGGRIHHNAAAIRCHLVSETTISHNIIYDILYGGIVVVGRNQLNSFNIEKNHIYNIGQGWLSDMGGIHTQFTSGIEIRGNLVHDVKCAVYGANCIYLDDHCVHGLVEFNLCYNSNTDLIVVKGSENTFRNNILAFGEKGVIKRTSPLTNGGRYVGNFEKNIVVTRGNPIYRTGYFMDIYDPVWNSDLNLIWDYDQKLLTCEQQVPGDKLRISFEEWKKIRPNDMNTVIADPMFRDVKALDFTLDPKSPAYKLGFENFDLSDVGPRPKEVWEKSLNKGEMRVVNPFVD